jgi:hypothetical protein
VNRQDVNPGPETHPARPHRQGGEQQIGRRRQRPGIEVMLGKEETIPAESFRFDRFFDHLGVNFLREPRVIGFRRIFARIMRRIDAHEFDALRLIGERGIGAFACNSRFNPVRRWLVFGHLILTEFARLILRAAAVHKPSIDFAMIVV